MPVTSDHVYKIKFDVESALRALDQVTLRLDIVEQKVKALSVAGKPLAAMFKNISGQINKGVSGLSSAKGSSAEGFPKVAAAIDGVTRSASRLDKTASAVWAHLEGVAVSNQKAFGEAARRIAAASKPVVVALKEETVGAKKVAEAGANLDRIFAESAKRRREGERQVTSAIKATETAIRKTDDAAQRKGVKTLDERLRSLKVGAGLANTSLTSLFFRLQALMGLSSEIRDVVGDYFDFDKAAVGASIRFGESMEVGTDSYKRMRSEIRELSVDAGVSSAAAMKSVEAWSKAGLNWDQTQAIMPTTLEAAVSMDLPDMAEAGDKLSDALGQFQMRSDDVETLRANIARVADVVVKAADISTLDPGQIFESYKTAAPMAAAMGESIERLSADLVVLGNAGIKGSEAGTALKGMFGALTAPRGPAREIMEDLKINVNDAEGNFRGLTQILVDFTEATKNMGSGERVGLLTRIVGREHIAGFLDLIKAGSTELNKLTDALDKAGGTSHEVAERMKASVSKQFDMFKQKAVDIGFKILEDTDFFNRMNGALDKIDFDKVSDTVTQDVIPALETLGQVVANVLWPAFQNVSTGIKTVFGPALTLAGWILDGVSEKGDTAATVLTALGVLWAVYKVRLAAAKAIDVVGYFAGIAKGAAAAAAEQGTLNTAVSGTTGALGAASKAATVLNGVFAVLASAIAGWTIGTVIYEQLVDPLIATLDRVAKLKAAVEDSRAKDEAILGGNASEKAVPVLEADLKEREKLLAEERAVSERQKMDAAARGVYLGDEKSDAVVQLEAEVANLKNRIATEKQKKQVAKYDVSADETAYQSEDLGADLRVTEYNEDWSPGTLDVSRPTRRPSEVQGPQSDWMSPELDQDMSVPVAYETPAALFTGSTPNVPDEETFDLPTSNPSDYLTAAGGTLADNLSKSADALAALAEAQRQQAAEAIKGNTPKAVNVTQKVEIGGANIVINGTNLTEAQLSRAVRAELKEHNRQLRGDLADAARSISAGED